MTTSIHELIEISSGTCFLWCERTLVQRASLLRLVVGWGRRRPGKGEADPGYKAQSGGGVQYRQSKTKMVSKSLIHSTLKHLSFLCSENTRVSWSMKTYQRSDWDAYFFLALRPVPLGIGLANPSCLVRLFVTVATAAAAAACLAIISSFYGPHM